MKLQKNAESKNNDSSWRLNRHWGCRSFMYSPRGAPASQLSRTPVLTYIFLTTSSSSWSPSGGLIWVGKNQINGNCDKWVFYPDEANIYSDGNIYWRLINGIPVATTRSAQCAASHFQLRPAPPAQLMHSIRKTFPSAITFMHLLTRSVHRKSCDNKFHSHVMMFAEREIRIVFAELSVVAQSNAICACAEGEASERERKWLRWWKQEIYGIFILFSLSSQWDKSNLKSLFDLYEHFIYLLHFKVSLRNEKLCHGF